MQQAVGTVAGGGVGLTLVRSKVNGRSVPSAHEPRQQTHRLSVLSVSQQATSKSPSYLAAGPQSGVTPLLQPPARATLARAASAGSLQLSGTCQPWSYIVRDDCRCVVASAMAKHESKRKQAKSAVNVHQVHRQLGQHSLQPNTPSSQRKSTAPQAKG